LSLVVGWESVGTVQTVTELVNKGERHDEYYEPDSKYYPFTPLNKT